MKQSIYTLLIIENTITIYLLTYSHLVDKMKISTMKIPIQCITNDVEGKQHRFTISIHHYNNIESVDFNQFCHEIDYKLLNKMIAKSTHFDVNYFSLPDRRIKETKHYLQYIDLVYDNDGKLVEKSTLEIHLNEMNFYEYFNMMVTTYNERLQSNNEYGKLFKIYVMF
jgi:hypothetical protein